MKQCSRCGDMKPMIEFPLRTSGGKKVIGALCKLCKPIVVDEYNKARRDKTAKARGGRAKIVSGSTGSYKQGDGSFGELKGYK